MKKLVMVLFAGLIVFGFGSFGFADTSEPSPVGESEPEPGSGGGGSGGVVIPSCWDIEPRIYQDINLSGFSAWAQTENEIGEGTYGSLNVNIQQGVFGKYYIPEDSHINVLSWRNEPTHITVDIGFRFRVFPMPPIEYLEWEEPPSGNVNFNAFGLDYYLRTQVSHQEEWIWYETPEGEEGYPVVTGDIMCWGHYRFTDFVTENLDLSVNEWGFGYETKEEETGELWKKYVDVTLSAELYYVGSYLPPILDDFPEHPDSPGLPEPATLSVLCLGSVLFFVKRRN